MKPFIFLWGGGGGWAGDSSHAMGALDRMQYLYFLAEKGGPVYAKIYELPLKISTSRCLINDEIDLMCRLEVKGRLLEINIDKLTGLNHAQVVSDRQRKGGIKACKIEVFCGDNYTGEQ